MGKGCEVTSGWTRSDLEESQDDGVRVVKSGTDFRELSIIEIEIDKFNDKDQERKSPVKKISGE